MRALVPVLGLLCSATLACGFLELGPKGFEPDAPPPPVEPAPTEPAAEPAAPPPVEPAPAEPVKLVQDPQVTIVPPDIPEGAVLGEVQTDYEHLSKTGKIESCPEGTTLQDKDGTDGKQSFCGLENGVRHGPWIAFWPNGKVREIGPYIKGYRNGTFTTWNKAGKVNSRYTWTNGQIGAGQVF